MARVLRFTRAPGAPLGRARFARFDEVKHRIDVLAGRLLGTDASLSDGARLYGQLEQRLDESGRSLLAELYEATVTHQEKFEHAAYLVGLQVGSGQLGELPVFEDDRSTGPERE